MIKVRPSEHFMSIPFSKLSEGFFDIQEHGDRRHIIKAVVRMVEHKHQ
jgi:hypothetical protein